MVNYNVLDVIVDSQGFPVSQYYNEEHGEFAVETTDGSVVLRNDVDFRLKRLILDSDGFPLPQLWDPEKEIFVPRTKINNSGISDISLENSLNSDSTTSALTAAKGKELNEKSEQLAQQIRDRLPNERNDDNRVQELLNKKGKIYFKKDTYLISKTMIIKDNTYVECHPEAVFLLADMSRCWMFSSEKTSLKNEVSWKGGIFNGNANNQGPEIEPTHDVSRALGFFNFKKVEVSNIVVKNIAGHGIAHWGNDYFYAHDIDFLQGLSGTHLQGGSRRDGITGSSKNIVFENLVGFTDDDFVAIISGYDWERGMNPISVENVTIRNIKMRRNDSDETFPCFRGVGIYSDHGYEVKNVLIENVSGDFNTEFMKVVGGKIGRITIKNCNVKSFPKNYSDVFGFIWLNKVHIDAVILDNIKFESLKPENIKPFIRVDGSSVVKKLENKSIDLMYNINQNTPSELISLGYSSNIDEVINYGVECEFSNPNQYNLLSRSAHVAEEIIVMQSVGSNGVIEKVLYTGVSVGNRQFLSFRMGEGVANPNGKIKINQLKLIKDGVDTGLLNPSMLTSSSTISATLSGDFSNTLQVTSSNHLYPNIRLNITLPDDQYTLFCEYELISGNRQLGIDFRYESTRTFSSAEITGDFKKKNAIAGLYDIKRTSSTDPKYIIHSDDITIEQDLLDNTKHSRYKKIDGNLQEINNNLILKDATLTTNLLSSSTFTLGSESKVQRIGNVVLGNVILYGNSQSGSYESSENLVRVSGDLGLKGSNKLEFSSIVFTSGSGSARYNDIFEVIFNASNQQIEIKALTSRTSVRWVTLNFMFLV